MTRTDLVPAMREPLDSAEGQAYRRGFDDGLTRQALDIERLDMAFFEMWKRGWITLPDGHGIPTFRDVFREAYSRTRSKGSPPMSDAMREDELAALEPTELDAWMRQTVAEAYHGTANLAHAFDDCGDPFCVEAHARMEQLSRLIRAARGEGGLDVERLAAAICNAENTKAGGTYTYDRFLDEAKDLFRREAAALAAEYAALRGDKA